MPLPSPLCTVNGVAPPIDVAASATLTIQLASTAGVRFWSIACTSTDELNTAAAVNATLSVNQTTRTATCQVSGVLGSAYIFTSTVGILGLGLDANATQQKALTTTFKVNVKASNGARVLAGNESLEQNPSCGWDAVINPALRAGVSVPITISGSGLAHVTGSTIDATAFNGPANAFLVENASGTDQVFVTIGTVLRGHINVTHASPGTLDATHQIAYCDSSTGTCSVTLPNGASFGGSIPADWQVLVVDTGGAAATSNITVNPNGLSIWDPTALAFGTSNVTGSTNGFAALWQWDSNKSHWVLVNAGGGGGGGSSLIPSPPALITGSFTPSASQTYLLAAGGATINLQNIVAGTEVVIATRGTNGTSTDPAEVPVTLTRGSASFTFEGALTGSVASLDDRSTGATSGTSGTLNVNGMDYRMVFDSTAGLIRCRGVA